MFQFGCDLFVEIPYSQGSMFDTTSIFWIEDPWSRRHGVPIWHDEKRKKAELAAALLPRAYVDF